MAELDTPEKFWKEFAEADMLKREEMMTVIVDNIDKYKEIEDETSRKSGLKILLLGYFEDLLQNMWT